MNHAAEIAAIKRRLDALEASTPAAVEARRQRGAAEERQRQNEAAEESRRQIELHKANEAQRVANFWKAEKAEKAARDANQGRFRDPSGIWRGADGRQLSNDQAAQAAAI